MSITSISRTVAIASAMIASAPSYAQVDQSDLERLESEVAVAKAKAELAELKAAKTEAILSAAPSYTGVTTTDASTGQFEASVLAVKALDFVADKVAENHSNKIVLYAPEGHSFQFGRPFALNAEMAAMHSSIMKMLDCVACPSSTRKSLTTVAALGIVTKIAGALRSETSISSISSKGIDSKLFASLTAAKTTGNSVFSYSDDFGRYDLASTDNELRNLDRNGVLWAASDRIGAKYQWLHLARAEADIKQSLPAATKPEKALKAKLKNWIASFDAFNKRVSMPTTAGQSVLQHAMRQTEIETAFTGAKGDGRIVVLDVQTAGGSLKNVQSARTFFGRDPLSITGGIIVSAKSFSVSSGSAKLTNTTIYSCSTSSVGLGSVSRVKFALVTDADQQLASSGRCEALTGG